MKYFIPKGAIETDFYEKKSRFITHLCNITSKTEAIAFIKKINLLHSDANHNCTAFIVGNPDSPQEIHCNDDGEPSGSSGKPMLHILVHKNIGDVVVVVTRYFGGVKLGTGGLARAYSRAVKDGLDKIVLIPFTEKTTITTSFQYQFEAAVRLLIEKSGAHLLSTKYTESVIFIIELTLENKVQFCNDIRDISRGRVVICDKDVKG
jgi:uncharacterized YigZ family protein